MNKIIYYLSVIILITSFFVINRPKKEVVLKIKTTSKEYVIKINESDLDNDTLILHCH